MKRDFVKKDHQHEYQITVKTIFASDPLTQFLQDFRNYITHYAIPSIGYTKQLGSPLADSKPGELYIDLAHLEKRFNWSASSRTFIEQNKPKIRMLKLVDDYEVKARSFTDDFMAMFRKYRGQELNEVVALMQESNNLWEKMTGVKHG